MQSDLDPKQQDSAGSEKEIDDCLQSDHVAIQIESDARPSGSSSIPQSTDSHEKTFDHEEMSANESREEFVRRAAECAEVNLKFLKALSEMGFASDLCLIALMETDNVGVAPAVDWLLENANDDGESFHSDQIGAVLPESSSHVQKTSEVGNQLISRARSDGAQQSMNQVPTASIRRNASDSDLRRSVNLHTASPTTAAPTQAGLDSRPRPLSFRSIVNSIERIASSVTITDDERTWECQICYLDQPEEMKQVLHCCGTEMCKDCILGMVTANLSEGKVLNQSCPGCGVDIPDDQFLPRMAPEERDRFLRIRSERQNPNLRSCPSCNHQQPGSASRPSMTCEQCGIRYCFVHANSHPGQTCAEWQRKHQSIERASQVEIKRSSKRCPRCKAPTQKSSGCNHMNCRQCGCNWCWICGSKIGGGGYPTHYKRWNLLGCSGAQFSDTESRWFKCLQCTKSLMILIAAPVALTLVLAGCAIYLPIFVGILVYRRATSRSIRIKEILKSAPKHIATAFASMLAVAVGVPIAISIWVLAVVFSPVTLSGAFGQNCKRISKAIITLDFRDR